jgi:hypothetical protein
MFTPLPLTRPKTTFGEMRDSGVRDVLVSSKKRPQSCATGAE